MTFAFIHMGDFFLLPFSVPPSNPSLEAQIPVSWPKSQSLGVNLSLEAQILAKSPDPSLEAQIHTLRPKSQSQNPNPSQEAQSQEEEEEEEVEIPICAKA